MTPPDVSRTRTSWMSRSRPCAAAVAASEASMRRARSGSASCPRASGSAGSMWVSTSTPSPISSAMASSSSEASAWASPSDIAPVDFEIERDGLAPFDLLDGDVVHRQASARRDHQHALEDRFVVELERIGGDGQFGLGPPPGDARFQLGLDRRDPLERQGAGDRDDDFADDPGAGRTQPDRLDPGDPVGGDDEGADGFGQASGRAVDERVDRRPAQAKAGHGDETGDADRGQRVGMRIAGPRRGEAGEHQDRRNEVARIVERVGGERVARRHARHMGQRAPAQRYRRRSKTGSRRWRMRSRQPPHRRRGCARSPGPRRRSRARRECRSRPAPPPLRTWRGRTDDRRRRACRPRARRTR